MVLGRGRRQRQHILAAALGATQGDRAGAPVDVVQAQPGDLTAAQPKIEGTSHDGVGAPQGAAGFTERVDQALNLFGGQSLGQCGQSPAGWIRQRTDQAVYGVAQRCAVAEVPAQRCDHSGRAGRLAVKLGLLREEAAHMFGLDRRDVDGPAAEALAQQPPGDA